MAYRIDNGSLRSPETLPDGRLRAEGYLTRAGVFVYRNPDGTERREYRPPDEVFRADSLSTFALATLTDDHPPELLTAKNAKEYAVGVIGESIRQDGEHVAAPLIVFDDAVIDRMRAGKASLSCGYECDLVDEPGEINGERYDAVQRNIRGNHVAIVHAGRAGDRARVRMDSDNPWSTAIQAARFDEEVPTMDELKKALVKIATLEAEVEKQTARADAAEKAQGEAVARADAAEVDAKNAKADLEKEKKARTDAADKLPELVRARVALVQTAAPILGDEVKLDEMTDREIKVAVVKRVDGEDIDEKRSDDYVDGLYAGAVKRADEAGDALAGLREVADSPEKRAAREDGGDLYAKFVADQRSQFKPLE